MPEPNQSLTQHEAVELHELISMQVVGIKKLKKTSATLPEDSDLANYINGVLETKEQQIGEFKQFISMGVQQ